jgi:hypothetical protein
MGRYRVGPAILCALLSTGALCHEEPKPDPVEVEECAPLEDIRNAAFPTFVNGQTVAEFALTQVYTSYEPNGCRSAKSAISLRISSQALVPVAFSYTLRKISQADGHIVWSYNGNVIRLAPGQTIDVGQISSNLGNITLGGVTVVFNSFSQVP